MSKEEKKALPAAVVPPTADAADAAPADAEKPECGFCVFMKAGGCAEAFEAWSRCVDSAREAEKKGEEEEKKGGGEGEEGAAAAAAAAAAASPLPSEKGEEASTSSPVDFATRCRDATMALQKCMEDHREYYKDFLADAEEAVAEKVAGGGGGGEVEEGEREKEEKKKEEES